MTLSELLAVWRDQDSRRPPAERCDRWYARNVVSQRRGEIAAMRGGKDDRRKAEKELRPWVARAEAAA